MSNDYPRRVRDVLAAQNKKTITIVLTNTGAPSEASGGTPVFDIGSDDYNAQTKELTHTFAVATIEEGHNTYRPSDVQSEIGIRDGNGNPVPITTNFDETNFLGRNIVGPGGRSMFVTLSDSDTLDINVIKGKQTARDDSYRSYDSLLTEINQDDGRQSESQLNKSVVNALQNANTTNPNQYYVTDGIKENESPVGKLTIQSLKGKHSKIPSYEELNNNVNNSSVKGYTITPNQFKNLGSQLPLLASGEFYIPNDVNNTLDYAKAQVTTAVPGTARAGVQKVSVKAMQPAAALNRLTEGAFDKDVSVSPLDDNDMLSFGNSNSWLVPYQGRDEVIYPMLAIQVLALGLVCQTSAFIFKELLSGTARENYVLNFYNGYISFFNITNTVITDDARFTTILFEQVAKSAVASISLGLADGVIRNPWAGNTGWYVSNVRRFVTAIAKDIVGVSNIGDRIQDQTTSGLDTVKIGKNTIFNNNLKKIVDMFAVRGASIASYTNSNGGLQIARGLGLSDGTDERALEVMNSVEVTIPRLSILNSRIRLNNSFNLGYGVNPQSIATAATRTLMLLPRTIRNGAEEARGDLSQFDSATSDIMSGYSTTEENVNRFDIETVKELEELLNSSYMPFYFHDLRTNEVVSFHAFLGNMSDNYSADWQNTTAYGRVEPVFQYTGTTRELQIDFFVVATNATDFDRMWAKINKLVTLVYPQFTKGRQVQTTDGKKFIQPFSQIPGASPVFRIRVGDVWKSNYNRFNVMRLFGVGQPEFNLTDSEINNNPELIAELNRIRNEITSRIASGDIQPGDVIDLDYNRENIISILGIPSSPNPIIVNGLGENIATSHNKFFGWGPFASEECVLPPNTILPNGTYTFEVSTRVPAVSAVDFETNLLSDAPPDSRLYRASLIMRNPPAALSVGSPIRRGISTESTNALIEYSRGAISNEETGPRGTGLGSITGWQPVVAYKSLTSDFVEELRNYDTYEGEVEGTDAAELLNVLLNDGVLSQTAYNQYIESIGVFNRRVNPEWLSEEARRQLENTSLYAQVVERARRLTTRQRLLQDFFNINEERGPVNPIMKVFEENGAGGGLAVVCKSINFDWNESRWSTDFRPANTNSRAPMWLKVQMSMTAIHDIVPGVGADGYMTAPTYPIGNLSNITQKLETDSRAADDAARERGFENIDEMREILATMGAAMSRMPIQ